MVEYDIFAASFARTRKKYWPDVEELIWLIPEKSFLGNIADIGCWSGRLCEYIPHFSQERYIWIDVSEEMLKIAREEYSGVEFREMDMSQVGQIGQKLDVALFIASFQHVCSPWEQTNIIKDTYELLNKEGYICLLNWNLFSDKALKKYPPSLENSQIRKIPFQWNPRTYFAVRPEEINSYLQEAGFVDIKTKISETGMNYLTIGKKPNT